MKTLKEIDDLLQLFENKYGLKVRGAEQGSGTWLQTKLGVLSASNAHKIVAKPDSDKRWTYLYELVGQILTGVSEEINSKYLDYGTEHEGAARTLYEMHTKTSIHEVPFIFKDESFRYGCSPDGIITGENKKGLELKVPFTPLAYTKFLCSDYIEPEYGWQCQFSMWITGADHWDFAKFSPTAKVKPLHIFPVKRSGTSQSILNDLVPKFIADMDKELSKIGLKFGDQWNRLKKV